MTIREEIKAVVAPRTNPQEKMWIRLKERSEAILSSVLAEGNKPVAITDVLNKAKVETPSDWLNILDYATRCHASMRDKTRIASAMSTWVLAFYEFEAVKPNG